MKICTFRFALSVEESLKNRPDFRTKKKDSLDKKSISNSQATYFEFFIILRSAASGTSL